MEIFLAISSSSQSVAVLPSATFVQRGVMPAVKSNDDTSCVLPVQPWPTMPTFRMSLVRYVFMQTSRRRGPSGRNRPQPAPGKLELREESVAPAPASPWGRGEGLFNNPWSGLLTRRMLTQGKKGSNAPGKENSEGT